MSSRSYSSSSPSLAPHVVAIVGTTGVGKTQLGVELAQAVSSISTSPSFPSRAEVINSDSMQVYRGLDLITNKATPEEMQDVKHHLIDFLEPGQEYSVNDFQSDALKLIEEMQQTNTLPILVGGTTYYLQHLVFPNQLVSDAPAASRPRTEIHSVPLPLSATDAFPTPLRERIESLPEELLRLFLSLPCLPQTSTPDSFPPEFPLAQIPEPYRSSETFAPALYDLLTRLDPKSAERWHWRDIRKVRRALEIVWEGREWGEVRKEQSEKEQGVARFPTLIFWLYAEPERLAKRLDDRVDRMLELGLLSEIEQMWSLEHRMPSLQTMDYSKGVFQAIGYKEFSPYLSQQAKDLDAARPLFDAAIERMKISTRQYAKRQIKWIKSKLVPAARGLRDPSEVTIVLLDATDLSEWAENVRRPALDFLQAFLSNAPIPDPTKLSRLAEENLTVSQVDAMSRAKRTCRTCTQDPMRPFLVEEHQWAAHERSKAHKRGLHNDSTPHWQAPDSQKEKTPLAVTDAI